MGGRATVNRKVQVGKETTSGTPVPADKQLPLTNIVLTRTLDVKQYIAQGFKIPGGTKINKDFGSGNVTAPLTFIEIIYLLSTIVAPVITTPGGGTLSREWKFTALATGEDAFNTLTIQEGDLAAATQMAYSLLTEFGIDVKLDDANVNGKLLGRKPSVATLTATPTVVPQLPSGPREVDVYMDDEGGTIGTTPVTDALQQTFQISNLRGPKWVLSTSQPSFKETVDLVPTINGYMITEHNPQSRTLFAAVDGSNNPVKLMRLKVTGPLIEGALNFLFQLDFAAQVTALEQTDQDGVWGYQYTFTPIISNAFVNGSGIPKMFEILVRNKQTAL